MSREAMPGVAAHVARERAGLGHLSTAQWRLIAVLSVTVAAWLFRSLLEWPWPGRKCPSVC